MDGSRTLKPGDAATPLLDEGSNLDLLAGNRDLRDTCLPPFAPPVCEFLGAFSKALRLDPQARKKPDLQTFAFWCRPAGIKASQNLCNDSRLRLGRGLTLHIAPGNIPVNTAFSLSFGLLAGNVNIVRAPSRPFEEIDILCRILNDVVSVHPYQDMARRFAIVRYAKDLDLTATLSRACAARMIWGGDTTVTHIRSLPTRPDCVDVVFPDRLSLCVMDSDAVANLGDDDLAALARAFFNDAYTMDQNACSSPRYVIWCGKKRDPQRFWNALSQHITDRSYTLRAEQAVSKATSVLKALAIRPDIQAVQPYGITLSVLDLQTVPPCLETDSGRSGFFFQTHIHNLDDLAPSLSPKVQTLTYFGITPSAMQEWALRRGICGISRIVPVGQALDMDVLWDGFNIVAELSRIVHVR